MKMRQEICKTAHITQEMLRRNLKKKAGITQKNAQFF
jgi:hypothetical protein